MATNKLTREANKAICFILNLFSLFLFFIRSVFWIFMLEDKEELLGLTSISLNGIKLKHPIKGITSNKVIIIS